MNKIKQWFLNNFVCQFKGHRPEKHLKETEAFIYTKRCSRCKNTLIDSFTWKKIKNIPPPNSTPEQIKEWETYCESKLQQLREGCAQ